MTGGFANIPDKDRGTAWVDRLRRDLDGFHSAIQGYLPRRVTNVVVEFEGFHDNYSWSPPWEPDSEPATTPDRHLPAPGAEYWYCDKVQELWYVSSETWHDGPLAWQRYHKGLTFATRDEAVAERQRRVDGEKEK